MMNLKKLRRIGLMLFLLALATFLVLGRERNQAYNFTIHVFDLTAGAIALVESTLDDDCDDDESGEGNP